MTTVFNYTVTLPFAVDLLDATIRGSALITKALANGSTLLGTALTVTFREDLPDDSTNVASVTCQPAALQAIVSANTGVSLAVPPQPVSIPGQTVDSDGTALSRAKQTTLGWTFQDHTFEFKPSTVGSVYSKDQTGVDFGFSTMKFYETVSGVETLIAGANATDQTYLTANCIATAIHWEPTWDLDVMAGELRFYDTITQDVRLWVVAVPDVPALYGGTKVLLTGRNLRYVLPQDPIIIDGRVVKHLAYSATYHTNKFRFLFRHPAGFASSIETIVQLYKA